MISKKRALRRNVDTYEDMNKKRVFKIMSKTSHRFVDILYMDIWAKKEFFKVISKKRYCTQNVDIFRYLGKKRLFPSKY